MAKTSAARPTIVPLPTTAEGIKALRVHGGERSIIDYAEDIFDMLLSVAVYRGLIDVVFNPDAKEGSISANHYKAAMMMQEKAKALNVHHPIATANLETTKKALRRVLGRHGLLPRQRKAAAYAAPSAQDDDTADDE